MKTLVTERQIKITKLKHALICLAYSGLSEANRGNPFWSRSDAMASINGDRKHLCKA